MAKKRGAVGIIGLGIMGGAFAKNLTANGWTVLGYDPSKKAAAASRRHGVTMMDSAYDVVNRMAVTITSLPKPEILIDVAREIAGHKTKLTPRTIVEMSTFEIEDKEKAASILKKAGHTMLDVPVSGTGGQAKKGDLVFYASGDSRTIKKLQPMFKAFGRHAYDVGAFGNGCRMKYVANLLVAINNVASAEAMVLGMKSGLKPQLILDLIRAGAGNSRVFELRAPMMVSGNYDDATMKIDVWQKDMQVIGDFARKIGVKAPLFRATEPIYDRAMRAGLGAKDTAAVCVVLEKMANYKRRKN